jgi:ribonucleoside-diphosphate reductase subunit M1
MYVVKRNGTKEEVHFDKITARIRNLTEGLDKRFIDPVSFRVPIGDTSLANPGISTRCVARVPTLLATYYTDYVLW